MTNQVRELAQHLLSERVGLVIIEATGDYWRQFYFLLEDAGLNVQLVNAKDARNLPGRKTDVSDAAWLAQLGAYGLVRGCLVPPADIRVIRDLTRPGRRSLMRSRGRFNGWKRYLKARGSSSPLLRPILSVSPVGPCSKR